MAAYMGVRLCGKSPLVSAVLKGRNGVLSTYTSCTRTHTTDRCFRSQATMIATRKLFEKDVFINGPTVYHYQHNTSVMSVKGVSTCFSIPSPPSQSRSTSLDIARFSGTQCYQSSALFCKPLHASRNSLRCYIRMKCFMSGTRSLSTNTTTTCWNCSAIVNAPGFFCNNCNVIQPIIDELNHFQRLQCEQRYDLNVTQLTQNFRSLQRQLHPDKYSNKSQKEQAFSADQSSAVNKAYSTLLKPLSRGLYLLGLHGHSIEESDSTVEPEFLMEVMETNEELAETQDMGVVRKIRADNNKQLQTLMKKLTVVFSQGQYLEARGILVHLKYYANIEDKAGDILGTDALE